MSKLLEVKNLTKRFGQFTAVDNIAFSIEPGEVVGLLGPNGAGKTTTIQMLLGITLRTSGTINYFGKDFAKNRSWCLQQINYASAYGKMLERLSVYENLKVFAGLYQVKDAHKKIFGLLERFEITDLAGEDYIELSAGQQTRVNLVKSLLNNPKLILMDEPTASLDPDISDKTLSLIEELREQEQISILYTSHEMDEVARICDRVIFLDHGKIILEDTPLNLTASIQDFALLATFRGSQTALQGALPGLQIDFPFPHIAQIKTSEPEVAGVLIALEKAGIKVTSIDIKKPTLDDVFLKVARGGINVAG